MYFQVNIGRNVGNHPMPDRRWADFLTAVTATLSVWAGRQAVVTIGKDGAGEMCAFVAVWELDQPSEQRVRDITHTLRGIAATYAQDGVAVVVGDARILPAYARAGEADGYVKRGRHVAA